MHGQLKSRQALMDMFEQALREHGGSLRFNRMGLLYLEGWGFTPAAARRAARDLAKAGRVRVEVERVLQQVEYTWQEGSLRKKAKGSAIFPEMTVCLEGGH